MRSDARRLPLRSGSVDLVVTSPPYFRQRDYLDGGVSIVDQLGREDTPAEYVAGLVAVAAECVRVLRPTGSLFVNLGDKMLDRSFALIPHRFLIACADDLGLTVRAEIIWSKVNGLPDKALDRVRRTHEYLFHLTPNSRYWSDIDTIRESHANWTAKAYEYEATGYDRRDNADRVDRGGFAKPPTLNPLGKVPGSVWEIAPDRPNAPAELDVDHFAPFPAEIPRRCIAAWSPPGGVVLDPFCGSGTTPAVARSLGRHGIGSGIGSDYLRLARWRGTDPALRSKIVGRTNAAAQGSLLGAAP